ncbi:MULTISPECIES: UDP-glucose 6-dehydrogenase [unclassified Moraxella]|uniref:UDP-glucose 6-dehydrogenase n=1 Tax=unclassified Moraxella TaxID=2685852 RepID=UPI003AF45601
MKNSEQIFIIGASNESLNACIVMASLDKQVTLVCDPNQVEAVLNHYRFERQLVSFWQLYTSEQKITILDLNQALQQGYFQQSSHQHATIWLFLDTVNAESLTSIRQQFTSPHQQIILSGLTQAEAVEQLADDLASQWVFYFPLTFMKDGENFSSMLHPDLVLIGEKTPNSHQQSAILLFFLKNAERYYFANIKTVAFARASTMTMLATRISFMNELARLADSLQVNIHEVQAMMGLDSRIGNGFLSAGWGFGGKALPLELQQLNAQFCQHQVTSELIKAVQSVNEDQKELIFRKFWRHFDGFIEHKTVMIWGAGYRDGTGRTTNSAIHPLLNLLWSYQIKTQIYATNTAFELSELYGDNPLFELVDDAYEPLNQAEALFIINWSLPVSPNIAKLNAVAIPIFDAKNAINNVDKATLIAPYYGIGR